MKMETIKLWFEKWLPRLAAIAASFAYYQWGRALQPGAEFKELAQTALNLAAIAVGFLVSAKAILLSVVGSSIVERLKRGGHLKSLVGYFMSAIWWSAAAAAMSAGLMLLNLSWAAIGTKKQIVLGLWIFCGAGAIFSNLRVLFVFGKLMGGISDHDDSSSKG